MPSESQAAPEKVGWAQDELNNADLEFKYLYRDTDDNHNVIYVDKPNRPLLSSSENTHALNVIVMHPSTGKMKQTVVKIGNWYQTSINNDFFKFKVNEKKNELYKLLPISETEIFEFPVVSNAGAAVGIKEGFRSLNLRFYDRTFPKGKANSFRSGEKADEGFFKNYFFPHTTITYKKEGETDKNASGTGVVVSIKKQSSVGLNSKYHQFWVNLEEISAPDNINGKTYTHVGLRATKGGKLGTKKVKSRSHKNKRIPRRNTRQTRRLKKRNLPKR
jgi:hypothetical protein